MLASSNAGGFRRAWAPGGPLNGMRPVRSWKSAAAAPTPINEGPSAVPCPAVPWQLAHRALKTACPAEASPSAPNGVLALDGGAPDNITCIVADVDG